MMTNQLKAGDRIQLTSMADNPDPIAAGTTGMVGGLACKVGSLLQGRSGMRNSLLAASLRESSNEDCGSIRGYLGRMTFAGFIG